VLDRHWTRVDLARRPDPLVIEGCVGGLAYVPNTAAAALTVAILALKVDDTDTSA
jgi:hypothetical protein